MVTIKSELKILVNSKRACPETFVKVNFLGWKFFMSHSSASDLMLTHFADREMG